MFDALLDWMSVHEALLWWLGALSIAMFLGTLIVIPYIVVRIPADYFLKERTFVDRLHGFRPWPVALRLVTLVLKNAIGVVLVLAGIAMLVLPGQGILTILAGLLLMNFPGKYELERRIVGQPKVLRAINWIRRKAHRIPLRVPHSSRA